MLGRAFVLRVASVIGAVSLVACAASGHKTTRITKPAAKAPASDVARIPALSFDELAEMFGTNDPASSTSRPNSVSEYREFVRRRLADPETYNTLMPVFFSATRELSGTAQLVNPLWLEMGVTAKGHKTFYYRRKPCAEDALERVHPWWKPSTEILVCRDDYRPTILADKQGTSCEVRSRDPNDTSCGCGPQLMFCGTDEVAQELNLASLEELQLTLKYLIESDRPYADVLAMNETVRSGIGNLVYARIDFFRTGTFKAPDPDQPPTLRPRSEVNLGGILSTPIYLWSDDRRAMLVHIMRDVMCLNLRARGVDTHTMLETLNRRDEHDLRAQTLMVLASTKGCQNCHALLENAQVAFMGWQSDLDGLHFTGSTPGARAKLYMESHEDLRAEGPADLAWLGSALASQPEFARCTVSKVANFVYEGREPPAAVIDELTRRFKDGQHLRTLIEDAVIARAFGAKALGTSTEATP